MRSTTVNRKSRGVVPLLALVLWTSSSADTPPTDPPASETPPPAAVLEARPLGEEERARRFGPRNEDDYRIGRQDLLDIRVFGLEELDQTVRVSSDGTIRLPLLGTIDVAGRTKTDLENEIAELLERDYVRDPQVSVFVKEFESKKVAVTGAVKRPGRYEMLGSKTLLEMISLAGGLDKDVGKEIIVFRSLADGRTERLPIDLEGLVFAADPSLNVEIRPEDIVYVPAIETVRIFVSGAVRKPDLYEVPRSEPVTVLKAITLAGGTTERAAEKRVQILRTAADGSRTTLVVNLRRIKRGLETDPVLQGDDLVLVPESFF